MNYDELMKALRERAKGGGIAFAKSALASIDACFVGGLCPDKIFEKASPEEWTKALKEAETQLVYHNPSMRVKAYSEREVPAGYCLTFDCVLTSAKRDRDGDILESAGAEVDPRQPLLWQHIPVYPIGKHFSVLSQNAKRIRTSNGIADTQMGRDAATLVKLDALRISHGFKPEVWEPIVEKGSDGKDYETGFRVKKFKVLETSLVSVPANDDAIIDAWDHHKLHHPMVKQIAKQKFDRRRKMVRSGFDGGARMSPITVPVKLEFAGLPEMHKQIQESLSKEHKPCGCGGKTMDPATKRVTTEASKGLHGHIPLMMPPIKGSWEYLAHKLESTAHDHLVGAKANIREYDDVLLLATYPDKAVVVACGYSPVPKGCWTCTWELKDGEPEWTGEPKESQITTDIEERAAGLLATKRNNAVTGKTSLVTEKQWSDHKAGKPVVVEALKGTIAKKHLTSIGDAKDLVGQVAAKDGLEKASKVLLDKSVTLLDEVLTAGSGTEEAAEAPKSVLELGRKLMAAVLTAPLEEVKGVRDDLSLVISAADAQDEASSWDLN